MRFKGFALALSAFVLGACGGGDKNKNATTDTGAAAGAATTGTDSAGAATATPAGGSAAAPATGTGTVHEVKMLGDAQGYRFDPANITIKPGDTVKWTMVSGGPHNVAFDPAAGAVSANKAAISAAMPNQQGELSSPMFTQPNETYQMTFANVPAGTYDYHCTPHLAMNMKGQVTVQ
jgi:plastocyanin